MKKSILLLFASISLLFSCSEDDTNIDSDNGTEINTVQLTTDETHGSILTDKNGMTLYFFSKDTKEISECSDGCKAAWPVFYSEEITLDNGLEAADFGVITRADGDKQTTYKGWPLYYFASDNAAGDINGDQAGDNWYVAKPDYSLMYAQAPLSNSDELSFYITNAAGRTIYLFANDTNDTNNFTNEDLSNNESWPIVTLDLDRIPSILDANDFGTINVFGNTQVTYKGWPLYYFGNDTQRGDANGVSEVWPTVNVNTEAAIGTELNTNAVKLATNSTHGSILTDVDGMTLYFFSKDTKEVSECSDGCKAAWPVFYSAELTLDNGLEAADFGEITRADGDKQTTYKGWPLYYFASDSAAGDVNGDQVGDNWYVAKPDYSLMYAQANLSGSDNTTFYITNASGRTIYLFANDTENKNNYTKEDLSNNGSWPMVTLDLDKIPSILNADDFGTINVFGNTQVTYKGWPLYYFGNDTERGDAKGVSGVWPITNTDTTSLITAKIEAETTDDNGYDY